MKVQLRKIKKYVLPVLGFLLVQTYSIYAQEIFSGKSVNSDKQQFAQGVKLYNKADFDKAGAIFGQLVDLGPIQTLHTASIYMEAKSYFQAGHYSEARQVLKPLFKMIPLSRYIDDAHLLLGMISYSENDYAQAANEFLWCIDFSSIPEIQKRATQYAEILFDDYLKPKDLRHKLRREYIGENGLGLIALNRARYEFQQDNRQTGLKIIKEFLKKYPNTIFRKKMDGWNQVSTKRTDQKVVVGVVLPLTGIDTSIGRALLRGIRFAEQNQKDISDYLPSEFLKGTLSKNKITALEKNNIRIEFIVNDSESSVIGAIKATQALIKNPEILAIIGEVDDSISSVVAALAQENNIPILIPVATVSGITSVGEFVFQLNADRERKGVALAEYAYSNLNCRRFVSIAPQDDYGQQMTDGLSAAVDSLGGEIFSQKWYYEGTLDLGRHFTAIREAAFRRTVEDTLKMTELMVDQSISNIDWLQLRQNISKRSRNIDNDVKELSIPVTNIDAVFLPLYDEDIQLIAPQMAYYNIQAISLGGDKWQALGIENRKELQKYIDGTIIASDYFVDWESERGQRFHDAFRTQSGVTPAKNEILGYDAANIMINCFRSGATTAKDIRSSLAELQGYPGMKGEISFNNSLRVNNRVNILKFNGAELIKVQ